MKDIKMEYIKKKKEKLKTYKEMERLPDQKALETFKRPAYLNGVRKYEKKGEKEE